MCLNLFPSILFTTFWWFLKSPVYCPVPKTPFCHKLAFYHHFVLIYDETTETIQQRQAQSSDQEILQRDQKGHCCHWTYECLPEKCGRVISNYNWCMWVYCSFTLPIGLKYRFLVENRVFVFLYLPIGLKSRFQTQTGWSIMSHKVVTRKKVDCFGKM